VLSLQWPPISIFVCIFCSPVFYFECSSDDRSTEDMPHS
jgi:hypothetical protein